MAEPEKPAAVLMDDEICFLISLREVMVERFLYPPSSPTVRSLELELARLRKRKR